MELKDFIKGSITSIVESIGELNEELKDKGVIIAPGDGVLLISNILDATFTSAVFTSRLN